MFGSEKFEVLAGDFLTGPASFDDGGFWLRTRLQPGPLGERVSFKEAARVDVATEETVKKAGGAIGWGAAGALVFGPIGLLAGVVLGGKEKEVTFVLVHIDGRKMLGRASV